MSYGGDPERHDTPHGEARTYESGDYTAPGEPRTSAVSVEDERNIAMIAHLCGLLVLFNFPIMLAHIIGPLAVWLWKRKQSAFIDQEAKEALNFNITITLYYLLAGALILILIGYVLLVVVGIAHIILAILAGLSARKGEPYRYPATIRFIK